MTKTESNRKKLYYNTLAVLFGVFASLLLLEAGSRLFKYDLLPYTTVNQQPCIYVEDDAFGYRYQANATGWMLRHFEIANRIEINAEGFHDVERPIGASTEGNPLIVAVGDSFTASLQVPVRDTWTQVAERALGNATVVNRGVDGTHTGVHLAILKDALEGRDPDLVILALYENDIGVGVQVLRRRECYREYVIAYYNRQHQDALRQYVDENYPSRLSRWMFDNLFTFRLASKAFNPNDPNLRRNRVTPAVLQARTGKPPGKPRPRVREEISPLFAELFSEFRQLSQRHGFRLIVVPVPTSRDMNGTHDALQALLTPQVLSSVEIVSVAPALSRLLEARGLPYSDLFWRYDAHFSRTGNELFGLAVAETIRPILDGD